MSRYRRPALPPMSLSRPLSILYVSSAAVALLCELIPRSRRTRLPFSLVLAGALSLFTIWPSREAPLWPVESSPIVVRDIPVAGCLNTAIE